MDPDKEDEQEASLSGPSRIDALWKYLQRFGPKEYTIAFMALVILGFVFMSPRITGLTVVGDDALTACEQNTLQVNGQLQASRQDSISVSDELAATKEELANQVVECNTRVRDLTIVHQKVTEEYETALLAQTTTYAQVVDYASRNICCKARVDNAAISGFIINQNGISCVESGGEALTCALS